MKRTILTMLFVTMFLGLTAMETKGAEVVFKTETVEVSGVKMELTKTADNFIILYDASSSMKTPLGNTDMRKIDAQKQTLKERNDALPELNLNAGLYTFTIGTGGIKRKVLKAYYPMQSYKKESFAKAIEQLPIKASGATYLQPALRELDPILGGLSGRTVVFLYTDGSYSRWSGEFSSPLEISKELANKHDVCFFLISNAEGEAQKTLLKEIASINACSRVVSFQEYLENKEYQSGALFVINERVYKEMLTQEKVAGLDTRDIRFDFDQSDVKPEFNSEMHALGEFLQDHPEAEVLLIGHADSVGDAEYNLALSRRRAETVADYLVRNFNLDEGRISVLWYGSADPVASNDNLEGRRQNRRVVSLVTGLQ